MRQTIVFNMVWRTLLNTDFEILEMQFFYLVGLRAPNLLLCHDRSVRAPHFAPSISPFMVSFGLRSGRGAKTKSETFLC